MSLFWTIRKWIFLLLSRGFWTGLFLGFLLSPLFSNAQVFYSDTSLETYSSFCGVASLNGKIWFNSSATSTVMNVYRSGTQTGTDNCYSLKRFSSESVATTTTFYIKYSVLSCSNCYMVAVRGTTRASYSVGQEWLINSATTSAIVSFQSPTPYSGFSVGMRLKSGVAPVGAVFIEDIYDSLGNDYFSIFSSESSSSASSSGTTTVQSLYYGDYVFGFAILITIQFLFLLLLLRRKALNHVNNNGN